MSGDAGNAGDVRDAGYDDWLDAIAEGEGYALACPNGHRSLPPRQGCPECGERPLERVPLPRRGEVVTFTVVHVTTPQFQADVPYVTAIAEFGAVRLTGVLRGVEPAAAELGLPVEATVGETATSGERLLAFRPA